MKTGVVKSFNTQKGFGFILSEGKEYFVHYSNIKSNGFKNLSSGDNVEFEPEQSAKGLTAKNVIVSSMALSNA